MADVAVHRVALVVPLLVALACDDSSDGNDVEQEPSDAMARPDSSAADASPTETPSVPLDATTHLPSDASVTCDVRNGRCPSGCASLVGWPYDGTRECIVHDMTLL